MRRLGSERFVGHKKMKELIKTILISDNISDVASKWKNMFDDSN